VDKEEETDREFSEEEKRYPNYLVPHLLSSLEKGMALLRLTVDSKVHKKKKNRLGRKKVMPNKVIYGISSRLNF
jgi:hypothetical protein